MTLDTTKRHIQDAIDAMQAALADLGGPVIAPVEKVTHVAKGENLQAAMDAAVPGEVVMAAPGEYAQLVLKPKPLGAAVVLMPDTTALPVGRRIDPSYASGLIQLRSNNGEAPVKTLGAASNYVLRGINPLYLLDGGRIYMEMGDHLAVETDPLKLPDNIVIDQCLLQGHPTLGAKCGIQMHTRNLSVLNSHISDFFRFGQDAQSIAGYNGPGAFTLINNFCSASGENILLGGADNKSAAMNPTNVIIRGNTLTKPLAWQTGPLLPTVKNSFELKNCVNALIEYNLIENVWTSGQHGDLVLFTVRNQDGASPWAQVANVVFRNNVVRHGAAGLTIIGRDNIRPSQRTTNIKVLNNLFYDIDPKKFVGSGFMFAVYNGVSDVEIAHNTCLSVPLKEVGAFLSVGTNVTDANTPDMNERVNVHDNVFMESEYGLRGDAQGLGKASWDAYTKDSTFERNLIAKGPGTITYPGVKNYKGDVVNEVPCSADFKLLSKYAALQGTSAAPLGADIDLIRAGVTF